MSIYIAEARHNFMDMAAKISPSEEGDMRPSFYNFSVSPTWAEENEIQAAQVAEARHLNPRYSVTQPYMKKGYVSLIIHSWAGHF